MAIQDGTPVITARGRRVGHIVGIVLDPATGDLSHLIVERGIVFAKPRLVPADAIDEIGPDRITLAEEVDPRRLPLYETERYVEVGGAA
ncbi:MAG: PRC-barrel domain-containing protein, partial [Acidimicrobiia bacterium]